jgi:hypothetical protein
MKATKEDILNAFHCPVAYFTGQTNLANLQAADVQHLSKCIHPRLTRRDEKLNEQMVPWFDPSGRLFLASDDPTPTDQDVNLRQEENDLKYGVLSINEVRGQRGLPPVPWGNVPWLPNRWLPSDAPRGEGAGAPDSTNADTGDQAP